LVVDDVAWIRDVLAAGLTQHGFRVLRAATRQQALELCRQEKEVQLALIDCRLPDGSGLELLGALHALYPDLRGCLMSGNAPYFGEEELAWLGKVSLIAKPFHLDAVVQTLRDLLRNGTGRPHGRPERQAVAGT